MLKKNMKLKGFTLIEIVVVLAIIGVLAAILVPFMNGYADRARKKVTIDNAEVLYKAAVSALAIDPDAATSFYSICGKEYVIAECTADGECIQKGNTGYYNSVKAYKKGCKFSEGHYGIMPVARIDSIDHDVDNDSRHYKNVNQVSDLLPYWYPTDEQGRYDLFVEQMCKLLNQKSNERQLGAHDDGSKDYDYYPTKMPYHKRSDNVDAPLIRWIICYRVDDPSQIEIWAGDGHKTKNGFVYRVYPNPNPNYDIH
ncbi:MAG: type II secretion system protein [Oscillospiraceae bacterium]|nr:type II secretion system protein [Oscillospiraceae bacterium]